MSLRVKFWGVRGSIACPSPDHVIYGGNTSCLEVTAGDTHIVFDAGSGLRGLGKDLKRRGVKRVFLLLTHTHWDHINGFPFFALAFDPQAEITVKAGHLRDNGGVQSVMARQMSGPTFPVPLEALQAGLTFQDFRAGDSFDLSPDVHVRTTPLNHPNGATGYRVEHGGHSICLVTDTEHVPGRPDQTILELIQGTDLVIYDSTYTDEEFPDHVGWGHSTWQEAIRLARAAEARQLAIFHHDPDHTDAVMEGIEDAARRVWDRALVARDGMELTIG